MAKAKEYKTCEKCNRKLPIFCFRKYGIYYSICNFCRYTDKNGRYKKYPRRETATTRRIQRHKK